MYRMNFNDNSTTIKAVIMAALTLVLLIPVSMVKSLINEREGYKRQVQTEINEKWGGQQELTGPILAVPILTKQGNINYSYYFPDILNITGSINPEERSRTIYDALVYQSKVNIKGIFQTPNIDDINSMKGVPQWDKASIIIGISGLQGLKNKIALNWDGKLQENMVNNSEQLLQSGISIAVPLDIENRTKKYSFGFDLIVNGSEALYFNPVGQETHIQLSSSWESPKFIGNFLPNERPNNEKGFDVKWDIFDYNKNYLQEAKNGTRQDSKLGVELVVPIDKYQKSMRSVKYAILFIALTFLVFFLVELLSNKRIHPLQYLMVSFALIIFYCLLLAISEQLSFGLAYLISSTAVVTLITAYSHTIFKNLKHTLAMGAFLIMLYVFLYVVLQLENLALLFGSISLFIGLAIVMYVSRKINWYKSDEDKNEQDNHNTPPPIKA